MNPISDLDDSSSNSSLSSKGSMLNSSSSSVANDGTNNGIFSPLPVEAPVNHHVTQEAIQHILPATTQLVRTTPVNEIFNEEPVSFHTVMDTQVEKALLSTFVSDEREMENALGTTPHSHLADELLAIVNEEQNTNVATLPGATMEQGYTLPPFEAANDGPALMQTTVSSPMMHATAGAYGPPSALAMGAVSEFNFPRKVYRMLDDSENNPAHREIVSWVEEGMAFKVHNKKAFVEQILPIYFDMSQYASFRRQLNMYSFERKHTAVYSNPFFARGCPDLLEKITRKAGTNSKGSKN